MTEANQDTQQQTESAEVSTPVGNAETPSANTAESVNSSVTATQLTGPEDPDQELEMIGDSVRHVLSGLSPTSTHGSKALGTGEKTTVVFSVPSPYPLP